MPRILENAASPTAIEGNYQRKMFRHREHIYLFYVQKEGSELGLAYRFAPTLSGLGEAAVHPATSLQADGWRDGRQYALHYDSHRGRVGLTWIKKIGADEHRPWFRYGDLQPDGSIRWSAEHTLGEQAYLECRTPAITCNAQGEWAVLVGTRLEAARHLAFFYSNTATPTEPSGWSALGGMDLFGAVEPGDHHRLGNGGAEASFVAFYKQSGYLTARIWQENSFSEPFRMPTLPVRDEEISAPVCRDDGRVYLAFFCRDNNSLQLGMFALAGRQWSEEQISAQLPPSASTPSLQSDSQGNLHILCRDTAGQTILYFHNRDGQWRNGSGDLPPDMSATYQQLNSTPIMPEADKRAVLAAWMNITPGDPAKPGRNEVWAGQVDLPLEPPRARFQADKTRGVAPCQVHFTDQSEAGSGDLTRWNWSFGDEGSSADQHPSHTYQAPGQYTVKLTVTDDLQQSDTEEKINYIQVDAPPEEAFECHPNRLLAMACYLIGWLSGLVIYLFKRDDRCIVFHALQSIFTFLPLNLIHYLLIGGEDTLAALFTSTASIILVVITLLIWLVMIVTTLSGIMLKLPLTGDLAAKIAFPNGRLPKNMRSLF